VPLPDRLHGFFAEFAAVQARPVTDPALVERMRTEATKWINAVHLEHRRIAEPLEIWRQEIDLHFLLVALVRLRRAVGCASRAGPLRLALPGRLAEFDGRLPYVRLLRNVGEHFDAYTVGKGRNKRIRRSQLQVRNMSCDREGHLIWNWLGEEVRLAEAHTAATDLYRGFLADVERYFAALGEHEVLADTP